MDAYDELSQLELARDGLPPYTEIRREVHDALDSINIPADILLDMYDKLKSIKCVMVILRKVNMFGG